MKRKKAGRKTRKTPPEVTAKPLRDLGGDLLRNLPSKWDHGNKPRTEINGIPLPPDLEQAIQYYSLKSASELISRLCYGEVGCDEYGCEEIYPPLKLDDGHADEIHRFMADGMREIFYLALLRYADDLKTSAEAEPLIEGLRQAARKGAAARRKQAAPTHRAIQKRFRELRKTVPKKTARYLRVAEEFEMSDRQVARIVDGID